MLSSLYMIIIIIRIAIVMMTLSYTEHGLSPFLIFLSLPQADADNNEVQLKVLQIVLQLANSLSADSYASQYLTMDNVCSMISISLQLCRGDAGSVSVSSTAFATARQLVALVMDAAGEALSNEKLPHSDDLVDHTSTASPTGTQTKSSPTNLPLCAQLLVSDMSLFVKGKMGEWIRSKFYYLLFDDITYIYILDL